jgi:hypothetical protein
LVFDLETDDLRKAEEILNDINEDDEEEDEEEEGDDDEGT